MKRHNQKKIRMIASQLLMSSILIISSLPFSTIVFAQEPTTTSEQLTKTAMSDNTSESTTTSTTVPAQSSENQEPANTEKQTNAQSQITSFAATHTELTLTANRENILSGESASFQLRLHNVLTNNSQILKNTTLKIQLIGVPASVKDHLNLETLAILGVVPIKENDTLIYKLNDVKSGLDINTVLEIPTENGLTPSGTAYSLSAELTSDSFEAPITAVSNAVTVGSESVFSVSTAFVNTVDSDVKVFAPRVGDETQWQLNVGLSKLATGSKFLKEGSQVKVTYVISGEATYTGVTEKTSQPTFVSPDKKTITWTLDAPTTLEQTQATTNLLDKQFDILVKINDDAQPFTKVTTTASVEGEFIDGQVQSKTHNATVMLTQSKTTEPPLLNGTVWGGYFYGPANGKGGVNSNLADANPTVYPDVILGWKMLNGIGHALNPWEQNHPQFMEITYDLDGHQDLFKFYSYSALYRPTRDDGTPLNRQPEFDLNVEYEDGEQATLIKNVQPDTMYSFTEGDYKVTKPVKRIILHYNYVPSANFNPGIYLYTTPKQGYTGEVTINPTLRVKGSGNGVGLGYVDYTYSAKGIYDNAKNEFVDERQVWKDLMTKRSANVVSYGKNEKRVYSQNVVINDNNKVHLGENTVNVTLMNLPESQASIEGTLESYLLLPIGTTYTGTPSKDVAVKEITKNYNNTGQVLLKLTYPNKMISIGKKLQVAVNVNVTNRILTSGTFNLFTHINTPNDIFLPDGSDDTPFDIMPTKETDINDLNGNKNLNETFIISKRTVDFINNHGIEINVNSGFVGADSQDLLKTTEGERVVYKLNMSNHTDKTLENVKIIGVLPNEEDYGLVTLAPRHSKFTLSLAEPISIKNNQNSFEIYYSTEKYIAVSKDLDKDTHYPAKFPELKNHPQSADPQWKTAQEVTDWSQIHSFKIVERPKTTIDSQALEVTIPLQVPNQLPTDLLSVAKKAIDRSAYLNVAVTANNYLPIENLKSGVYVNRMVTKKIHYVDTDGNTIHEDQTISGELGSNYEIDNKEYQLTFQDFTFKEVKGQLNGTFSETNDAVTYIYTKNKLGKKKQPEIPKTDNITSNTPLQNEPQRITQQKSNKQSIKKHDKEPLPSTGSNHSIWLMVLGLIIVGCSLTFIYSKKDKPSN